MYYKYLEEILKKKKETPILFHTKMEDFDEEIHILSRFGTDVKITWMGKKNMILTGKSLFGFRNILFDNEVESKSFYGGIEGLILPDSEGYINLFGFKLGYDPIENYLANVNHWYTGANFEKRLPLQMAGAKVFGMDRKYIETEIKINFKL